MNLQKVGRISKLLDKKKELDLLNEKFYAPEYQVIKAGRASAEDKPLKNQISNLAELAQVIKQSREKQFELSQAKILSELKQSEFFEKQAKPVVKAVEENAPDDNTEELKEVKNRLLKAGMPLEKILTIEAILISIVESVSKNDSDSDKYLMLNEYYPIVKSHPSVVGFESIFEKVMNEYYSISNEDLKYEKFKREAELLFSGDIKLNEKQAREALVDADLNGEQVEKLINHLLSKGIIIANLPVTPPSPPIAPPPPPIAPPPPPIAPPPVIPDDGERKAEPPAPVEPIMPIIDDIDPILEDLKEKALRKSPREYIGGIQSKAGLKNKLERDVKVLKQYKKQLIQFIENYIVKPSPEWEELPDVPPPPKSSIESAPKRGRPKKGRGLTMEDLRTKTSSGIKKKLGLIPPSGVILGKGLNISDMTPAQLMNNLALNIASQKAGNSGVSDVINAIIDQMNKKNIISKAEHKKLWYAYCD
jgi:hypothetical protein